MMSMPALACETAVRASSSSVASFRISYSSADGGHDSGSAAWRRRRDCVAVVINNLPFDSSSSANSSASRRALAFGSDVSTSAAVAVRHVLAQANIAHQQQAGHFALDGARRLLHDAVIGPGAGGDFVLRLRQAEEDDAGNAQRLHLGALLHRFVDRQVVDPGHGAHFLANAFARANEQRIDEAFRAEAGFADKRAHRFGATQAAGTINWECHNNKILAPRE